MEIRIEGSPTEIGAFIREINKGAQGQIELKQNESPVYPLKGTYVGVSETAKPPCTPGYTVTCGGTSPEMENT